MKRREFIKTASIAIAATPFATWARWHGNSQVGGAPDDAAKYLLDDPEALEHLQPEVGKDLIFNDLGRQTDYLRSHFAKHSKWEAYEWDGWETQRLDVTVDSVGKVTRIVCAQYHMLVELGAVITLFANDELRIVHNTLSGAKLDWRFRPAFRAIMGVNQVQGVTGKPLEYEYRESASCGGGGLAEWDELDDLMWKHQIECCVIDRDPESFKTREFQNRFPESVFLTKICCPDSKFVTIGFDQKTGTFSRQRWYFRSHPSTYMAVADQIIEDKKDFNN